MIRGERILLCSNYMMKKIFIYLAPLLITFGVVHNSTAEEFEKLSAYKVTTYNLGALMDFQETADIRLQNFEPLLITSTKADILNHQSLTEPSLRTTPDLGTSTGFAISAEYKPTDSFSLQGTFGMAKNNWDPSLDEHESSWEANLGLVYKLLDNLNYEVHFGYMETGDVFKERSTYSDVESIIMVSNKLSMSF